MCLVLATGPNQQVNAAASLSLVVCPSTLVFISPSQLASWATEAFFKYGGEPHFIFPTTVGPASSGSPSPMALGQYGQPTPQVASPSVLGPSAQLSPGYGADAQSPMVSAPGALGRALVGPEVQRSGKNNGLCRYLARLLR